MTGFAYQVVVSFQYASDRPLPKMRVLFQDEVLRLLGSLAMGGYGHSSGPISVAVRQIGAGGEQVADEGCWDAPPSHESGPRAPKGVGG